MFDFELKIITHTTHIIDFKRSHSRKIREIFLIAILAVKVMSEEKIKSIFEFLVKFCIDNGLPAFFESLLPEVLISYSLI